MNDTAKLEISAIAAAFSLGILGDMLLRTNLWGLNFALWGCSFAAAIACLGRFRREVLSDGGQWLPVVTALSTLTFLWRDSTALCALSVLALITSSSLLVLRAQGGRLRVSSLAEYALSAVVAGVNSVFGMFPLLFGAREWKKSLNGNSKRAGALLRGALLSVPPLLIFGALLAGADAVFKTLLGRIFNFDLTHVLLVLFITFGAGGYLRGLLFGKELKLADGARVSPPLLGTIEMGIILGLLDLLFLAFVVVQIRYFFGGAALVHATAGLTYAEYCRRGFFELLAVAAILLPFLLIVHWLLPGDNAPAHRLFKWLAGFQIALMFVIMASAVQRMRLYQAEYGLSESRLYPTAFMGWLAVVFVWFCWTVLRGHREQFAFGAMVAGILLVATLQVINPDALIARTNMQRAHAGHAFDADYVAYLSADAVPEIVAGLPAMNPADRRTLAKAMLDNWLPTSRADWRSWSVARARAWQTVTANQAALRANCLDTKKKK